MNTKTCPLSHTGLSAGSEQEINQASISGQNQGILSLSSPFSENTAAQVLQALEAVHDTFIDQSLKEKHAAYILAIKDFMEVAFIDIIQDINKYERLKDFPRPLLKILQVVQKMRTTVVPDYLKMALINSVSPEDWKYMMYYEFPEEGKSLVEAGKNFGISADLLAVTLQGGWENAITRMFDIFERADLVSGGDANAFDDYCKDAEKFILRLSATSLSVHAILTGQGKKIWNEKTKMKPGDVEEIKNTYIQAAKGILPMSEATRATYDVREFASMPRKGCPALVAKDEGGASYILVFFRLFGELYKEQLIKK